MEFLKLLLIGILGGAVGVYLFSRLVDWIVPFFIKKAKKQLENMLR